MGNRRRSKKPQCDRKKCEIPNSPPLAGAPRGMRAFQGVKDTRNGSEPWCCVRNGAIGCAEPEPKKLHALRRL